MKNNRLNLILYIIAALMIFIPMSIVFVTGKSFDSFHSKVFVGVAITFVIVGRILTIVKKTIYDKCVPWVDIGIISGIFITLIGLVLRI
ncbi:hypothetical protein [Clostridium arbusti]|jgi:hypothetical protein|uniref:hypothetical protein n=1 Tax=Clostridium arbusti TaxID=1137848 RepID=UPI0002892BB6|nr:hypothetical protein [Clostridium arbusti]